MNMSLDGSKDLYIYVTEKPNTHSNSTLNVPSCGKKVKFVKATPDDGYDEECQSTGLGSLLSHRPAASNPTVHPSSSSSITSPPSKSSYSSSSPESITELHYFTLCPHTYPPATRPLNVQPTLISVPYNPAALSVIEGRCHDCDSQHRRDLESHILTLYQPRIGGHQNQLSVLRVQGISYPSKVASTIAKVEEEIRDLLVEREEDIRAVWKGYSARWGPGTIEFECKGRMKVEWIRPARDEMKKKKVGRKPGISDLRSEAQLRPSDGVDDSPGVFPVAM